MVIGQHARSVPEALLCQETPLAQTDRILTTNKQKNTFFVLFAKARISFYYIGLVI